MHLRIPSATAIGTALLLLTAATGAPDEAPVVLDLQGLQPDPAGAGVEPEALYHPEPSTADRWRDGLAGLEAAFASDLAALGERGATARGDARGDLERELQARKLLFEIEVLELQLTLHAADAIEATAAPEPSVAEGLRASVAQLRRLRERILDGGPAVMPSAAIAGVEE